MKMTRWIRITLAALGLAGCASAAPSPTPAPQPQLPPRVAARIHLDPGVDRRGFLAGFMLATQQPIEVRAMACGGKLYAWGNYEQVPIVDVPCDCVIEQYKAEGCFALKWEQAEMPKAGPTAATMEPAVPKVTP